VLYLLKRRGLTRRLLATGREVGRPLTDRLHYTLQAILYSVIIAAVWPLLIAVTGWQLTQTLDATDFSRAVSMGLLWLAPTYFFLRLFHVMCIKGGVAEVHFRWSHHSIEILRREFSRLMLFYLPAAFVAITLVNYDEHAVTGAIGRLAIVILQLALAVFFYHMFEPRKGALKWYLERHKGSLLYRLRYLWFVLSVAVPLVLVMLSIAGYLYTAGTLTGSLARTLWLFISLIIVQQVVVRWLLLTQRRLTYQAALEHHKAERAAQQAREAAEEGGEGDVEFFEEPDVDLVSLSSESRKLLNMAIVLVGATGMYFIWSRVLPAFGVLREITLWHYMGVEAGEEQLLPITLADLGLAILVLFITVIATKRFPAFLEMVLLQRIRMSSGGRYTAKTLSRYTIIAAGVITVASMLGGSWSQIQWLVAALGVGIGFGLQEIVANFICGLIILFERPIRVGDRVIVGDVEGFVTRIQIRATTIQTFDRAELLVPNKEFITGRLINMSLSDTINRLVIPVGVAYGSDVHKAMELIMAAAREHERIVEDPRPLVTFESFGDNSLLVVLRCFLDSLEFRLVTISELHEAINEKLNAAGIVIAFPQRDLHLDTLSPLDIRIHSDKPQPDAGG
jgi:potassium efflux system protein